MYLRFFGFRELPFELTPNPRFLYLTSGHREALANLQYGLSTAKPITVLTGEAGTGKTTLIRTALESAECRMVRCLHLTNPTLTRAEFVETLASRFHLSSTASTSKSTMLRELEQLLRARLDEGEITALVVDEAQRLSSDLLEEVRLLANLETDTQKLLPLVLAGQPELSTRFNENQLRQLKQRIALRCHLAPMTLPETANYIAWRVSTAGGQVTKLFTRDAVILIHEASGGIPRTISVLCDNALLTGYAMQQQPIGRSIVAEVIRDFDLGSRTEPGEAPAPQTLTLNAPGRAQGQAAQPDKPVPGEGRRAEPEAVEAATPSLYRSLFR